MNAEQERLVLDNMGLAGYLGNKASARLPRWIDRDDIFQEGRIGLIKAAMSFDPSRGFKFVTYASWRITGAIKDYLRTLRADAVDLEQAGQAVAIQHTAAECEQKAEVRRILRRSRRRLTPAERAAVNFAVLGYTEAEAGRLMGTATQTARDHRANAIQKMRAALNLPKSQALNEREMDVWRLTQQGRADEQIAAELMIPPRRVEIHKENIMRKLGVHRTRSLTQLAMDA